MLLYLDIVVVGFHSRPVVPPRPRAAPSSEVLPSPSAKIRGKGRAKTVHRATGKGNSLLLMSPFCVSLIPIHRDRQIRKSRHLYSWPQRKVIIFHRYKQIWKGRHLCTGPHREVISYFVSDLTCFSSCDVYRCHFREFWASLWSFPWASLCSGRSPGPHPGRGARPALVVAALRDMRGLDWINLNCTYIILTCHNCQCYCCQCEEADGKCVSHMPAIFKFYM